MAVLSPPKYRATAAGRVAVLIGEERDADQYAAVCRDARRTSPTRVIRGTHCAGKTGLFREWAAALQFPYYFGHNWDAFEECLGDLSWVRAPDVQIIISNADAVLLKHPRDFLTFATVLTARAAGQPRLDVVFQCRPAKAEAFVRRLAATGTKDLLRIPAGHTLLAHK